MRANQFRIRIVNEVSSWAGLRAADPIKRSADRERAWEERWVEWWGGGGIIMPCRNNNHFDSISCKPELCPTHCCIYAVNNTILFFGSELFVGLWD